MEASDLSLPGRAHEARSVVIAVACDRKRGIWRFRGCLRLPALLTNAGLGLGWAELPRIPARATFYLLAM